jgi:hypothetical protein
MQYWKYSEGQVQYRVITGTTLRVRFGQLGGLFVTDCEMLSGGFASAEDVGWVRLSSSTSPSHSGQYREGVRSANYVLDSEQGGIWEQLI